MCEQEIAEGSSVDGGVTATDSRFASLTEGLAWSKADLPTSGPLRHNDYLMAMMRMGGIVAIIIVLAAIGRVPPVRVAARLITSSVRMGTGSGSQGNAQHGDS